MNVRLLAVAVLIGVLSIASPAQGHPGHDHGQEMIAPAGTPTPSVILIGSLLAMALVLAGVVVSRPRQRTRVITTCFVAVGCTVAALIGCGRVEDKATVRQPQTKHVAKDLEALFAHFQKDGVAVRADDDYLYIESSAFPNRKMMVGITAWQQQVPLPQPYTGNNAWRIPLQPVIAAKPISAKTQLYRGAIALAVDGVPIFNALNNRGEDAFLAGELDEFGGHCGRGDDYHYHIAPLHLEKVVGKGKPIAYALDGFPIYGLTDADGDEPKGLDEFNGRFEKDGSYRYYASKTYPYINGGMRGEVSVRGDQIEPQPKDAPVRPAGRPLRGAKITDFTRDEEQKTYTLKYEVDGTTQFIRYTIGNDGEFTFVYGDGQGGETTKSYRRREQR